MYCQRMQRCSKMLDFTVSVFRQVAKFQAETAVSVLHYQHYIKDMKFLLFSCLFRPEVHHGEKPQSSFWHMPRDFAPSPTEHWLTLSDSIDECQTQFELGKSMQFVGKIIRFLLYLPIHIHLGTAVNDPVCQFLTTASTCKYTHKYRYASQFLRSNYITNRLIIYIQ